MCMPIYPKMMLQDRRVCYKTVRRSYGEKGWLTSPIYKKRWHVGLNKSNRKSTRLSKIEQHVRSVYAGIHVYWDYRTAAESAKWNSQTRVLPVVCYKRDLVARGSDRAVFTKVWVLKKDYDKAVK